MNCLKLISPVIFLLFSSILFSAHADSLAIKFYYQHNCPVCEEIENLDLPRLADKYGNRICIDKFDTGKEENFIQLLSALETAGRESNATAHMVIDKKILCGRDEIRNQADKLIDAALTRNAPKVKAAGTEKNVNTISRHSRKMNFLIVAGAGLIDGINPCVISALIFLMSVLALAGIENRKLILAGLFYCAGSFITYTLIGFGLLSAVRELSISLGLREWINQVTFIVLLIFSAVSVLDAIRFLCTKSGGNVIMKLPRALQLKVHRLMRKASARPHLVIGAFMLGSAVTVIETLCTGQIYVPTLVYMLKHNSGIWRHIGLLLLYNAMFTVPTIGVFALMAGGFKLKNAIKLGRYSVVWAKFAMALFFLVLAIILKIY
jgi:cytochrome c biogenesis protein CcdA